MQAQDLQPYKKMLMEKEQELVNRVNLIKKDKENTSSSSGIEYV